VARVDACTSALDASVDSQYRTAVQGYAGGRVLEDHADKASTAGPFPELHAAVLIHDAGMTCIRGQEAQFEAWAPPGNTGWDWKALILQVGEL
jgi:choline dehydrogenase-like flavoprotein